MTDRTTELLHEGLTERGVEWKNIGGTTSGDGITEWLVDGMTCRAAQRVTVGIEHLALYIPVLTPEQAIAATLGDEAPKKCSTCQYRYVVGQRPYPTFGYMCGFGDGKKLCGGNTSVLDHMSCEHWEKEMR